MITFIENPSLLTTVVNPIYVVKDHAFTAEPRPEGCTLSVVVNEVALMVDEIDRRVVFVEGYCPHPGWQARRLSPPHPRRSGLVVEFDEEPVPGVSRPACGGRRWPVFVDTRSRWICIGEPSLETDSAVEFANDTMAVVDNGRRLRSLWVRPRHIPSEVLALKAD